jgi:predicted amidohydrolase
MNMIRAAAVQMDIAIGENDANRARVLTKLDEAADNGATLVVFPECALSGYCFESLADARPFAETPDTTAGAFVERCRARRVTGVVGFLELDGSACHNSAVIATPDGNWFVYRKTHLPTLGIDRFVVPGDDLPVFRTPFGTLGVLICYDIRFSEAARTLALLGADVIALPTNWPKGAESSPDFITRARAWENRVFVVAANRVGVERGRPFIGRSQIVAPSGEILVEASRADEVILYADLDLTQARQKRIVNEPGEWELDITGDRRPELYSALTQPT